MKRLTFLALLVVLVTSCESGKFGGSSSTNNKSKSDDKPRPTEQGEGVVGYLTNPGAVRYIEQNDTTIVEGDAGAVEFSGAAESYEACLQELPANALQDILRSAQPFSATVKGRGPVQSDGSFRIEMSGRATDLLAINVSGFCDSLPPSGFRSSGTSVVFKQPGSEGFATAESYASDTSAEDETEPPLEAVRLCSALDDCTYSVAFTFQDKAGVEIKGPFKLYTTDAFGQELSVLVGQGQKVIFAKHDYDVEVTSDDGHGAKFILNEKDSGDVRKITLE